MKTIRFHLQTDEHFPMFRRLVWEVVDVSFRDVLEQGVHPWTENNQHHDLPDAFVERLNRDAHKPVGLVDHHIIQDVNLAFINHWNKGTRFEQMLEYIQKGVLFCKPTLDFAELSAIAHRTLAERWNSNLALRLAERLAPSFQELRRFLKTRDGSVKLRGQMDLRNYDWSSVLSLDDFANHEKLIIDEAVSPLNFRNNGLLDSVTDEFQRLRMVSSVDHVSLTQSTAAEHRVPVLWQAARQGNQWRLRPNVGASSNARSAAQEFAIRWRRDMGNLCFSARTEDVIAMVESNSVAASFPGLRYTLEQYSPRVSGQFAKAKVPLYVLGGIPTQDWSGERLKSILREYGVSTTGIKKKLVEKLAELSATEYRSLKPLLDGFFSENRFVRVSKDVRYGERIPVLGKKDSLRGLLLHMYALRHLRGNVVIDPTYENDSCDTLDLGLALLTGRITLPGGFLRVN